MRSRSGRSAGRSASALRRLVPALAAALVAAVPGLPAEAQDEREPAPKVIYLVRHGAYDEAANAPSRLGGALVPAGVEQAHLAGARLRGLPVEIAALRSSPLIRARQTAVVIADELGGRVVEIEPRLEECTPPTWRREAVAGTPAEELAACRAQLERLVAELFRPSSDGVRHEILVAHGNVIRYLVTRALRVDPQAWLEMSIGHASITELRIEADGSFRVISVGDVGHLPVELQSGAAGDPAPRAAAKP